MSVLWVEARKTKKTKHPNPATPKKNGWSNCYPATLFVREAVSTYFAFSAVVRTFRTYRRGNWVAQASERSGSTFSVRPLFGMAAGCRCGVLEVERRVSGKI